MSKKYYVVLKGRQTGIFEDWNECEKSIKGFSGAEFKSFKNYDDAYDYCHCVFKNTCKICGLLAEDDFSYCPYCGGILK